MYIPHSSRSSRTVLRVYTYWCVYIGIYRYTASNYSSIIVAIVWSSPPVWTTRTLLSGNNVYVCVGVLLRSLLPVPSLLISHLPDPAALRPCVFRAVSATSTPALRETTVPTLCALHYYCNYYSISVYPTPPTHARRRSKRPKTAHLRGPTINTCTIILIIPDVQRFFH